MVYKKLKKIIEQLQTANKLLKMQVKATQMEQEVSEITESMKDDQRTWEERFAKRFKTETRSTVLGMEATESTEKPVKAKMTKLKLPTEGTKKITTTVKEAKERLPPLVF